MLFALDFDKTFTRDPGLWVEFLRGAHARAHRVVIISCRSHRKDNYTIIHELLTSWSAANYVDDVICTGHQPKRQAAAACGHMVDIWIDDAPETIGAKDADEIAEIEKRFGLRGD